MKDEICATLGRNIKKFRKLRGYTQEKLAELLNMEIKSLSLIETGNCFVSSKTLAKLIKVLDIEITDLFDSVNSNNTEKIYNEAKNALEILKDNPAKLKILYLVLKGLL